MTVTSTEIVNQAINLIGDNQPAVTGVAPNFDSSTAGKAAAALYGGVVATVGRQHGWDFSRNIVALTLSGNAAPVGWLYEYLYPTNGIQIRQIMPNAVADPNDPLPQNWTVGNTLVAGTQTKVIWANLQNAVGTISNQPTENTWDPLFREAVVRLLASEMAMALEGKPDTSRDALEQSVSFEQLGSVRDS